MNARLSRISANSSFDPSTLEPCFDVVLVTWGEVFISSVVFIRSGYIILTLFVQTSTILYGILFWNLVIAKRAISLAEADLIKAGKIIPGQRSQARAGGDKADVEDRPGRLSEDQRRYAERMGLDVREVERLYRARVERERNFRPGR